MEMKTLQGRLMAFQKEVGAISKDSTNPFFKSKYFDINGLISAIKPLLEKNGLVLLQPLTNVDGKPALQTIISDDNEKIEGTIVLPELADPQKMGSVITYYRRYAIQSMLMLQAEDNDGEIAAGRGTKSVAKTNSEPF